MLLFSNHLQIYLVVLRSFFSPVIFLGWSQTLQAKFLVSEIPNIPSIKTVALITSTSWNQFVIVKRENSLALQEEFLIPDLLLY